jgi:hypothetical protein
MVGSLLDRLVGCERHSASHAKFILAAQAGNIQLKSIYIGRLWPQGQQWFDSGSAAVLGSAVYADQVFET